VRKVERMAASLMSTNFEKTVCIHETVKLQYTNIINGIIGMIIFQLLLWLIVMSEIQDLNEPYP
jgi:hypothetical protein